MSMIKNGKMFVILLIICLSPIMVMEKEDEVSSNIISRISGVNSSFKPILPSYVYTSHDPIVISQDSDFDAAHGVVSGTGIEGDPFIIENWNITGFADYGIIINNTSAYFLIRNCWIYCEQRYECGIFLNNNTDGTGTLIDNTCLNNGHGIQLFSSNGNFLSNNTCADNYYGIYLRYSNNNSLTNSICYSNSGGGIRLRVSNNNFLINNTCNFNNETSIYLIYSNNNSLINNTCLSNTDGSRIYSSFETTIINNSFERGLDISGSIDCLLSFSVEDNSVNGLPMGFFINQANLSLTTPSSFGQLILVNCTGAVIKNQIFLSNLLCPITLHYCSFCQLENNSCSNTDSGIFLDNSDGNYLINNFCSDNKNGIKLWNSSNNSLIDNFCSNNYYGINLYSSDNNFLVKNKCESNNWRGIYLCSSNYNSLSNNSCTDDGNGIFFSSSNRNLIVFNFIVDSLSYSISLDSSSNYNHIHHNFFINNVKSPQAYDNGLFNQWFDELVNEGNYWSDYVSGDYQISGDAKTVDPYPLDENGELYLNNNQNYSTIYPFSLMLVALGLVLTVKKRKHPKK